MTLVFKKPFYCFLYNSKQQKKKTSGNFEANFFLIVGQCEEVLWFSKDLNWLVDCLKVVSRYSFNCYDFLWCNSSIQRCRYLCLERYKLLFEYKTVLYGHLAPWKISLCNTKSTLLFGRLQASVITVMEILGVSGEIQ